MSIVGIMPLRNSEDTKTKEKTIPILLYLVFRLKSSSGGFVILNNIIRDKNAKTKLKMNFM